ncbi:MAG TPA: NAD-dependent epimerase/dehydratase family protein, partial [Calditrichaeota bacterium]|nr:NAD-dependent epimerase/dehydratase family protein [Calditrichota bacterium]
MKIAITGCDGFVGKKLTAKLEKNGYDIAKIDLAYGFDVTDFNGLESIERFDLLIHLAARIFVPDSFRNPRALYHTNVNGTLNVLEICRKYQARIVFTSTYVYGIPEYLPIDEQHPLAALNPYTQSKLMGEELCRAYQRDFGLNVVILRPFNIYGPGQNERFLIPTIIAQAKNGKINLQNPRPKRDLIYIDDLVDAYVKTVEWEFSGLEIFNIGSGRSYSVRDIVRTIINQLPKKVEIEFSGEERPAEIPETLAGIDKIKTKLHWLPRVSFTEGIRKTIEQNFYK